MNGMLEKELAIENMIYEIRGKQVMLDSDLAKLYQCKNGTKEINQAVKNNINKFPERYSWVLTDEEDDFLRSKFLTTKMYGSGGRRNNMRVFTEQGIAMLATILKGEVATQVSIKIMDAFVAMRKYISNNLIEQKYINNLVIKHDERISLLEKTFDHFKTSNHEIYFDGQIYDAYSKIIDIMKDGKKEITTILITRKNKLLNQMDIDQYNRQYYNLKVYYDNTFHDRYIILDREIVYHCGTSLNHIGEKTFSINKLDDKELTYQFIKRIESQFCEN